MPKPPQRPKHQPIELTGIPPGMMVPPEFAGSIQIEDLERTPRYVKYIGRYHCVICDAKGTQVTAYWRDKWPNGVTDELVEADMKLCVQKNHVHRGWGRA